MEISVNREMSLKEAVPCCIGRDGELAFSAKHFDSSPIIELHVKLHGGSN